MVRRVDHAQPETGKPMHFSIQARKTGTLVNAKHYRVYYMLLSLCGILALSLPAYLIVAARYDWKYAMRFAMDERGIRITPAKVVIIGWQMRLAAAWGSFDRYTEFSQVKSIRVYPRYHLIRVNAPLRKNQVYAEPEDFNFVLDFIVSRCPGAKISKVS